MNTTTDEIKIARRFSRDTDGEWIIKCGHCKRIMGVEAGDDDGTPRGEQYQDRQCNGWTEVSAEASFVKEL